MPPPAVTAPVAATEPPAPALRAKGLNAWYGAHQAIRDVNLNILPSKVTAIIGPSRLRQVDRCCAA